MNKEQVKTEINNRTRDLVDMSIDLSRERRILLDFVETCAVLPRGDGKYTHNREDIQQKARKILEDFYK